ncbi:2',5'-phosphodiesterase 12 isoform X2 [Drosophila persimilis]|uniref:2',5'-phosphodiesterase 12 isoform X2 n=1 Tax=Drosophila persimilis TaxID=7234 RepID=UPI000F095121|nr:2',5'-phosphodiesterase 12 isoform X2 [Drosophila persimilis]
MDINKVYIRYVEVTDEINIVFRYVNQELNVDRDFSFCRKKGEPVFKLLLRIRSNVEKELEKSLNKSSKRGSTAEQNSRALPEICLLKVKKTDKYMLVANTHLYFHPDADHIRLLQIGFALTYIEYLHKQSVKEHNITDPQNIGLIFCGDFNSVPDCGVYKLMTEQFVDKQFSDWCSNPDEAVVDVELAQPFKMFSACGKPRYTNYTALFSGCLDYIFCQQDRFELLQCLPLPTEEQLTAHTAIPSICFPSDHIALVADLSFESVS